MKLIWEIVEFNFENGGYYEVNMGNANDYISKFRESGYFSDNYIKNLENSFEEIKKNLEENKQNDGAPEGMDADWDDWDWFLATQEIDYYLDIINNQMKLDDIRIYSDDDNVLCISNEDMGEFLVLENMAMNG